MNNSSGKISSYLIVGVIIILAGIFLFQNAQDGSQDSEASDTKQQADTIATSTEDSATDENASTTASTTEAVVQNSNTVYTWGHNSDGQLGKNLDSIPNPIAIEAGHDHTVVLDAAGDVWTFGSNEHGQLGRKISGKIDAQPAKIPNLPKIVKISTNFEHTLLLDEDGGVWAFGSNYTGQIGDGKNTDVYVPYKVSGLGTIEQIEAGYKFSLAIDTSGNVYGWGASCNEANRANSLRLLNTAADPDAETNEDGEGNYYDSESTGAGSYNRGEDCLNEPTVGILSKTPKKISGLKNITEISAGYGHAVALDTSGNAWAFGCNLYGQLGREHFDNSEANSVPAKIQGLPKLKAVAAGFRHSVAVTQNGDVYAWGINSKIDANGNTFNNPHPFKMDGVSSVADIIAGRDYSIALTSGGALFGWGENTFSALSNSGEFILRPQKIAKNQVSARAILGFSAGSGHVGVLLGE